VQLPDFLGKQGYLGKADLASGARIERSETGGNKRRESPRIFRLRTSLIARRGLRAGEPVLAVDILAELHHPVGALPGGDIDPV
jgi:hypothetical protein